EPLARPEARAAALVAVALGVRPARIARHRAGRSGGAAPREARDGEIEAAPEEVDGAAFAEEPRAEFTEHAECRQHRATEALRGVGVVGAVRLVLVERDRVLDLGGPRADRRGELELVERRAHGAVEVRDRAWAQLDGTAPTVARREHRAVIDEI